MYFEITLLELSHAQHALVHVPVIKKSELWKPKLVLFIEDCQVCSWK